MPTPPNLTVGALAVAAHGANAVGAVRISCAPGGLEIELVRAFSFLEDFAPAGVAEAVRFQVPYVAVRGLVRRGDLLCLALDPVAAAPHTRFTLARFTDDPAKALARAHQARSVTRAAWWALPAPIGALAAWLAPSELVAGALGRGSLGLVAALAAWLLLRQMVALTTRGGRASRRAREAFEDELSRRLGIAPPAIEARDPTPSAWPPAPLRAPVETSEASFAEPPRPIPSLRPKTPRPGPARSDDPIAPGPPTAPEGELFPRPRWTPATVGAALFAVALFAVASMAFVQRHAAPRTPPPPAPFARTGVAEAALRAAGAIVIAAPPPEPSPLRCACVRADSPLFRDGVPALGVIAFRGEEQGPEPVTPRVKGSGPPRYDFDLAVVNDAARPLHDVRVTLTFARRSKSGRRVGATDRGLFWSGDLLPGRSVKWHVSAPGSEMRMDASVAGTLEKLGLDPAPADAFATLSTARYRAVRFHAAEMLAYVRDPRAIDAAIALGARTPEERALIEQIKRAAAPVIACDVRRDGDVIEACVFNGSSAPRSDLALVEARDPDADGGAPPRRYAIEGSIPVHEGVRVRVPFEGDPPDEWAVSGAGDR